MNVVLEIKSIKVSTRNRRTILISLVVLAIALCSLAALQVTNSRISNGHQVSTSEREAADLKLSQYSGQPAQVASSQASPDMPSTDQQAVVVASINGCVLSLSLSSVPGINNQLDYSIEIRNIGRQACSDATVSVYYADNETFVSSAPIANASNYYWKLGTLPSGGVNNISFVTNKSAELAEVVEATQACATADNSSEDACSHAVSQETGVLQNTLTQDQTSSTSTVITQSVSSSQIVASPMEYGSWIWESPIQMSADYENSILSAASANGINVLYVTIDDYLAINAMPDGAFKTAKLNTYMNALQQFILSAHARGIDVDAEAGWRDWGEPAKQYEAFAIVDFVKEYNASHSAKIRALQYDVEPYLLPGYESNKAHYLKNFVELIDSTVTRLGSSDIRLNVVIPHFYDDKQKWTPAISYNDQKTFTYNLLLTILDKRPGSALLIMAYRNFAKGTDGSIDLSSTEINEASSVNHSTKVIVSQETGNVDPEYVTFYGKSKAYYNQQVGIIRSSFAHSSGFGGIAVHYIDPFMDLR